MTEFFQLPLIFFLDSLGCPFYFFIIFFFFHKSFSCHKSYNLVFLELKIFKFKFRFISPWIKDLYLKRKTIKLME